MDILQTVLNYISIYIESITIAYMLYALSCMVTRTFQPNKVGKELLLSFVVFIAHSTTNLFIELTWLRSLIAIIVFSIATKYIYKIKFVQATLSTVIVMIAFALFELLIVIAIKFLGFEPQTIKANATYNMLIVLLMSMTCFIFTYSIFKAYTKTVFKLTNTNNLARYMVPQCIAIIICLVPSMALLIKSNFNYSNMIILVNVLQLCVISVVSIYNIKSTIKQKETELKLENTIIHNQTLTKVNEGVRGFKHDMGNIVQAILGYIALNDTEGAKAFCQNLVIGFNDINVLSILSPKVINDPAIYGVVVNKILVARENNMKLTLDISADVASINFPEFELSRILGILIDNAIEAGTDTEAKELILTIHTFPDNLYDEIIISNSIKNANIPLDKIFTTDYSSKSNPSGFGLYEVGKILDKYNQGIISTSVDKDKLLFTQKIKIFK